MDLTSLLTIDDGTEKDKQLRRAFAPYSPSITVDGNEFMCLIILINMTIPRKRLAHCWDISSAQKLWCDGSYIEKCLAEVYWYHTHNLKYPNTKVSGQRLRAAVNDAYPNVLSSANLPHDMGWSHDSKKVNLAKLFLTKFIWDGNETTLGILLSQRHAFWEKLVIDFGVPRVLLNKISKYLHDEFSLSTVFPEEISEYSKQVIFCVNGEHISITPVVSHAVQTTIQKLRYPIRKTTITHNHPASVSSLVSSVAGNIQVLDYPPLIRKNSHHSFLKSRRDKKGCFDYRALRSKAFRNALKDIVKGNMEPTLRLRRKQRVAALRVLRKQLILWVSPMMEWRDVEMDVNDCLLDTLEDKLIGLPLEKLPELALELSIKFHQSIQFNQYIERYAFHPELMEPVKNQIRWLLKYIAGSQDNEEVSSQYIYIHLQNLTVEDASSLSNPYITGIPSLTALWGFIHNYQLRLNKLGSSVEMKSVAWFISDYLAVKEKKLPEQSILTSNNGFFRVKRSGIIDGNYCDLSMDLIIKITIEEGSVIPTESEFMAALPSRFAGGTLLPPLLSEQSQWLQCYQSCGELFSVIAKFPSSGCWIYPDNGSLDSFDTLTQRLTEESDLKPVHIGFIGLETPKERTNATANKHCFAEPCIGVVKCKNAMEVRFDGAKHYFESAFWQQTVEYRAILMKKGHKE
ncbi:type I-F CRISPR-associated protein Csy2 [Photobacterium damselae]|uniref:type I-F CRISPR-associated protein Csy2 n=1 Tax=Photobacterium damselae TaxID=38293 RepID=UPI001EFD4FE2|nr:type I-F CRISPR-associated protein Csy2 [Photobacterium damselae]MCG9778805.1 hypothetical protein [Photobacterium damselae]